MLETAPRVPTLWYMGAKTRLLDGFIEDAVLSVTPQGTAVLDLATGTGAVAEALAPAYRVIANDIQRYGQAMAGARLVHDPATAAGFVRSLDIERDLGPEMEQHRREALALFGEALAAEDRLLAAGDPGAYRRFALGQPDLYGTPALDARRARPAETPYLLATAYYGHIYFGLRQALEIDALRQAIDHLPSDDALSPRERAAASLLGEPPGEGARWAAARRAHYLACLLFAASRRTSGTSHFAEPQSLEKDLVCRRVMERRRRSVLDAFRAHHAALAAAIEEAALQPGNEAWCLDFREALDRARTAGPIGCVYLDPPYTQDHYSRFYHALEAIARYDYPPLEVRRGRVVKGRYPALARRHQSPFSNAATVEEAFRRTAHGAADLGAALVVSYSSTGGLLFRTYRAEGASPAEAKGRFLAVFRERYDRVRLLCRRLMHSGQGDSNLDAEEVLAVCAAPRRDAR